jgi:hypothetical protein
LILNKSIIDSPTFILPGFFILSPQHAFAFRSTYKSKFRQPQGKRSCCG